MTKTPALPMLLDMKGVAEHLGVSERHVRRLVSERRIPFVKWGRYIRFDPNAVANWINDSSVNARVDSWNRP